MFLKTWLKNSIKQNKFLFYTIIFYAQSCWFFCCISISFDTPINLHNHVVTKVFYAQSGRAARVRVMGRVNGACVLSPHRWCGRRSAGIEARKTTKRSTIAHKILKLFIYYYYIYNYNNNLHWTFECHVTIAQLELFCSQTCNNYVSRAHLIPAGTYYNNFSLWI